LLPEKTDAVIGALPAANDYAASAEVQVFDIKVRELAHSQGGGIAEFDQCAIARRARGRDETLNLLL